MEGHGVGKVPELRVTGIVGAVGQTIRKLSDRISASDDAQPCPVSPRPWRKISVPVCFPRADTTTGLSPEDILEKTDEEASLPLLFLLLVSCVEDRGEPRERHSPIEEAAVITCQNCVLAVCKTLMLINAVLTSTRPPFFRRRRHRWGHFD